MHALITILDSTTETSMPFNEFVVYRGKHYTDEKQILIICGQNGDLPKADIPKDLRIEYAGRKLGSIRKTIKHVLEELNERHIPYVIHMHQVLSGVLAELAMLGTGFRKKVLFTVHSTFTGYKLHNKVMSFINCLLAQRIICVSNASFQAYPKLIKRIKGKRIQTIRNGVDIERIDRTLSSAPPKAYDHLCFIYVARLIPSKNHAFLIDVLSRCSMQIHFKFVGEGDLERTIKKRAEKLGVSERVTFTGLIPRNKVFEQLWNSDFYISSSMLEGLPVSVLEAMCCGLPCVLSDIPQHREVAEGEAAILPFDIDKWAAELDRLAETTPAEREKQAARIRQYVTESFSLESMHKEYDSVYALL